MCTLVYNYTHKASYPIIMQNFLTVGSVVFIHSFKRTQVTVDKIIKPLYKVTTQPVTDGSFTMASRNDCADSGPCKFADSSNFDLSVPSSDNDVGRRNPAQKTSRNDSTDLSTLTENRPYILCDSDNSDLCQSIGNKNCAFNCRSSDTNTIDPCHKLSGNGSTAVSFNSTDSDNSKFHYKSADIVDIDSNKSDIDHTDSYGSADFDNTNYNKSVDRENTVFYRKASDKYNIDLKKYANNNSKDPCKLADHDNDEYESVDSDNDAYTSIDNDEAHAATNRSETLKSHRRNLSTEDVRHQQVSSTLIHSEKG